MMVGCPGCNTQYSIDERKISAKGARLTCRECGYKWKILPPSEHAGQAAPPPPPADSEQAPPLQVQESSAALQRPVNCPQCGHLFVPYGSQAEETGRTTSSGRARKSQRPKGRVLLVEDQNYFAELTREALGQDFETIVAPNLAEARSALEDGGLDLVILDLSLENGQDGTQVLQALRQKGLPVLIFTARDESDLYGGIWDSLKAAGATDILIKGMNVGEELRQKVQSMLSVPRK